MFDGLCYLYQNMTRTWNSAVSYCKDSSQQEHLLNLSLSYISESRLYFILQQFLPSSYTSSL